MEVIQLFMILSFLVYLQTGLFVFWKSPFIGLNIWFSSSAFLFSLWSAAYVFSELSEAGEYVFPLVKLTLTGLAFLPPLVVRIFFSIYRFPANVVMRNGVFVGLLIAGTLALVLINNGQMIQRLEEAGLFSTWQSLLPVHMAFLILHFYLYSRLHFQLLIPGKLTLDVIDYTDQIIILCDVSFRIIYPNSYTQKTLGYNESNISGKRLWSILDIPDRLQKTGLQELEKDQITSVEARLITLKGNKIHVQADIFKVTDIYKDVQGYVMVARVTDYELQLKTDMLECENALSRINRLIREVDEGISNYSMRLAEAHQQQAEKVAESKNFDEMIISDIHERELLTGEIHERVISNMEFMIWLIEQYRAGNAHGSIVRKLDILYERVHTILMVHRHLYFAMHYSDVDFRAFVYDLTAHFSEKYDQLRQVGIRLTIPERFIEIDKALSVGLILSELIHNAYLHAFNSREVNGLEVVDPTIEISLVTTDDSFVLMVKDNGPGLPFPIDMYAEASGGLALVDILVKGQLGGTWFYRFERGAMFQVFFI